MCLRSTVFPWQGKAVMYEARNATDLIQVVDFT